jgi:aminobenzoyl-glutamate utilization protein B
VVQAQAEVLYLIRAPEMADAQQIYARIEKIAQGAALMTETSVACRFEKACSSYLPNRTLEAAMYQAVCHYGTPSWSEEDRAFADEIRATLSANDLNNSLKNIAATGGEEGKRFARRHRETVLIDEVAPWAARITSWRVNRCGRRQLENAGRPVLQPLFCRRHTAAYLATGEPGPHLHCP